jgi:hypothetical protein
MYPGGVSRVLYTAAEAYHSNQRIVDDYELDARSPPLAEVRALPLSPVQRMFIDAVAVQ